MNVKIDEIEKYQFTSSFQSAEKEILSESPIGRASAVGEGYGASVLGVHRNTWQQEPITNWKAEELIDSRQE